MDINEKNTPTPAPSGEGQAPAEGKRPQNRNRHRRGKGKPQGDRAPKGAERTPADNAGTPGESAAPTAPAPTQGQKKQNQGNAKGRSGDRKPQGQADRPAEEKKSGDAGGDRKPRRSTGRPQRTVRHSTESELPNMDNLLIDDSMVPDNASPAIPASDTDAEEIERILAYDIFAENRSTIPEEIPEGKVVIVGIRFRAGGKTYYFDPGEMVCPAGKYAIVETAHGLEFGEVCIGNRLMDESAVVPPLRPVVRMASPEDIRHNTENRQKEQDAFRIGVQKIKEHKLDMKLVEVQYTFDNTKLLFYFTSEKRVDFRELVRDLAGVFHIRIELRQIGIRDEARLVGGLGLCGRPLCCTSFLSDFGQVSMKMAKEQNLSLNSTKISGCCGRLMCCLRYEHEAYVSELKRIPPVGSTVNTPDGAGTVTEVFVLKSEVKVSLFEKTDSAPKRYKVDQIEHAARDRRNETPRPASPTPAPLIPEDETDSET